MFGNQKTNRAKVVSKNKPCDGRIEKQTLKIETNPVQ